MLLQAIDIQKSFGGVKALQGVSLDVQAGEVHALVGENGAGKSTLIKVLVGALQPEHGEIWLSGRRVERNNPARARELGISVIYQQPALFPHLTVAENIGLANDGSKLWHRVDWKGRRKHAARLMEQLGSRVTPDALVSSLSMPEQQMVEIAKALDANASVLIMDEPTASLGKKDTDNLLRVVSDLRVKGTGIIYISHRLEELFRVADRVTVLRDGSSVGMRNMAGVTTNELIRMMVGRDLEAIFPKRNANSGEVALRVDNISSQCLKLNSISFEIRQGEILGLAGLVGSGRTHLAEALFGLWPLDQGAITIGGSPASIHSPVDARNAGLSYVPEDRCRHGVILKMSIAENTTLASLGKVSSKGLLRFQVEYHAADELKRRLRVKAQSVALPVGNLSGGNQQKVALARWLMTNPRVLILDEPTQGIDIGAKSEIYQLIDQLAHAGMAILLISSDMSELLAMSDRIGVMCKGTLAGVMDRSSATPDEIMRLALGYNSTIAGRPH